MDTTVTDPFVGRLLDERYRVGERIARGGMATVYTATDTRLERTVALKVMTPALAEDPEFVARFVREARAAARVTHPNIVAVHDQGTDHGDVFLVMEHVPGQNLRDLLRARGRLTVHETFDVLEPLLDALAAAHAAGLVHRDVKPENVLIADDGRIKVADFGLARATTSVTTATSGVLIGTVAYLSPEQVERGNSDERSDVYAAGIVLYEMLTGNPPYAGETPISVAYRHVNEDVPPPSSMVPGLPHAVDALVAGSTARTADHRYRDADRFLAAVRAARGRLGLPAAAPLTRTAPEPMFHDTLVVSDPIPADHAAAAVAAAAIVAAEVVPPAVTDEGRHDTAMLSAEPVAGVVAAEPGRAATRRSAVAEEHAGRRRRRRRRSIVGIVLLIGIIAAVAALAWRLGAPSTVAVPGVIGQTTANAHAKLSGAGFEVKDGAPAYSETVPVGRVITMSPSAGAQAESGSTVTLVASKGPQRFAVPNVAGATLADAKKALTDAQLTPGEVTQAWSDKVGKGLVISTSPKAGTKLKRDTTVALVTSRGAKTPVPSVKGKTQAEAQSALTAVGLKSTVTEAYSNTVPTGTVISQSPSSGKVPPGSTIALTVSKGPAPIKVPNVVNMKLNEATKALESAGFKVRVLNLPGGPNIVLDQNPNGGELRQRGTTITLSVF